MMEKIQSEMEDKCRFCMKNREVRSLFPEERIGSSDLPVRIKATSFARIQISEDDGLPAGICSDCESGVNFCYSFKLSIEAAERSLRSAVVKVETGDFGDSENFVKREPPHFADVEMSPFDARVKRKSETAEKDDSDIFVRKRKSRSKTAERNRFDIVIRSPKRRSEKDRFDIFIRSVKTEKSEDDDDARFSDEDPRGNIVDEDAESKDIEPSDRKVKPHQCDACGQIFKTKMILVKHLETHSPNRLLYECSLCRKRYTRAEHLYVHARTHAGQKPYVCERCGRAFTKKQDMLRHQRIHSDDRNFPCPRCPKRFKRSADVIVHMRSHTGVRPYPCKMCSKSYSSRSGLVKHNKKDCTKLSDPADDERPKTEGPDS